jgi:aminopeptidase N
MKSHSRVHARCACSSAAAPFALSGTLRKYERSRPYVLRHSFLDLVLEPKTKSVRGTAHLDYERISANPTDLVLDAIGFDIERVELAGRAKPLDYEYDGDHLTVIGLSERTGKVSITYSATPKLGLYFLAPDDKVKNRPEQVWSQCQDEDARHWFPCLDKPHVKMTTELRVKVPQGWTALSNGERVDGRGAKNARSFHFRLDQPHPSYLVTLVAGRFVEVVDRPAKVGGKSLPVSYFVPPERKGDALRSLGETPRMIELFSSLLGVAFPFSRYSQIVVSDFIFGGMENTTATTLYEHVLLDARAALDVSSNDLVAHELAHQWFGDHVTCRDWSHAWLNEGFATFFEHLERESRLGRDDYEWGVAGDVESYLAEANGRYSRPIVCRDYGEPIDLFDRHLYEKGGLVLHMLRRELGDELFFSGVRLYLTRNAGGIVETNDLMRALEEVSGKSLERFFDSWVYRPGHPDLKVKIGWEDGLLSVQVRQKQKGPDIATFAFTLEVLVKTKAGTLERHSKQVTEGTDTLLVRLPERPAFVVFDPEFRLTTSVTLEAPAEMLRHQLESAPTARARWMAAEALSKRDDPATRRALTRTLFDQKEAWMVRTEAARALGKLRGEEAEATLIKASAESHPKLRRAVASALGAFRTSTAASCLAQLAQRDKSYLVAAEAARALGRTRAPEALKTLLRVLDAPSWADVRRAGALDGLAQLRSDDAVPEVLARSRYGYPLRGRRAAIQALAALSDSKKTRSHLEDMLEDKDPHLRISVVDALLSFGDAKSRGALRRALDRELDGRVIRRLREALRENTDGASEKKRVSDDLETLRNELAELKARLGRVEATTKPAKADKAAKPEKRKVARKR